MGDVLFALVNLARHVEVDAEGALRRTIDKFTTRFAHVESRVKARARRLAGPRRDRQAHPLEVLDGYWEEAKTIRGAQVGLSWLCPTPPARSGRSRDARRMDGRGRAPREPSGLSTRSRSSRGSTRAA